MNKREIKFRAWNTKTNKMIDLKEITPFALNEGMKGDGLYLPLFEELPLMQYTGLKDKNGKPIYEGDIINAETELKGDFQNLIVVYNPEYVGYTLTNQPQTDGAYLMNCEFWAEVIGNMYENPELLTPPQP